MNAMSIHALAEAVDLSQSLVSLRLRPSYAKARLTTHLRGKASKPSALWDRLIISTVRHMMITYIEWLVLPRIMLNEFRLWQHNGMPNGFASWAYLG